MDPGERYEHKTRREDDDHRDGKDQPDGQGQRELEPLHVGRLLLGTAVALEFFGRATVVGAQWRVRITRFPVPRRSSWSSLPGLLTPPRRARGGRVHPVVPPLNGR
jgi:hypothetical protein